VIAPRVACRRFVLLAGLKSSARDRTWKNKMERVCRGGETTDGPGPTSWASSPRTSWPEWHTTGDQPYWPARRAFLRGAGTVDPRPHGSHMGPRASPGRSIRAAPASRKELRRRAERSWSPRLKPLGPQMEKRDRHPHRLLQSPRGLRGHDGEVYGVEGAGDVATRAQGPDAGTNAIRLGTGTKMGRSRKASR